MLNQIAIAAIKIYQKTLSPDKWLLSPWLKGKICAHEPHCSQYAIQCFQRYWFFQALTYTFDRIISCTPDTMTHQDPSHYKVVFASWAPIGVPFLEAIHADERMELVWVMTMPDAPYGRWHKVKQNIIATTATQLGITYINKSKSLRLSSKKYAQDAQQAQQRLTDLQPDLLVVVAYGHILPQHILDIASIWSINVHWSLLPAYRGASPLQSVFLHWESETGVTVMLMDEWLDTGDMLSKLKTQLPLDRTVADLIDWIQTHSPSHLLDTLRDYAKGDITPTPQEDTLATHCTKIDKQDGQIDPWNDRLIDIYRKYQAYKLWPKIYFTYNEDKRAIIESLTINKNTLSEREDQSLLWLFGEPIHSTRPLKNLNPAVQNITIKPEVKKAMTWDEFSTNFLTKS